jgi:hypothetical protein
MNKSDIDKLIPLITKADLISETEWFVRNDDMQYKEAVIAVCDRRGIEPEDIAKLVASTPLKSKLQAEAQRDNLLPKPNSLFDSL